MSFASRNKYDPIYLVRQESWPVQALAGPAGHAAAEPGPHGQGPRRAPDAARRGGTRSGGEEESRYVCAWADFGGLDLGCIHAGPSEK